MPKSIASWFLPLLAASAMLLSSSSLRAGSDNLLSQDTVKDEDDLKALWSPVKNREFSGELTAEPHGGKKDGPVLKVAADEVSGGTKSYGEWRFKEQPEVNHGGEYRFRVWAKGKVDAPAGAGAYVNIYGLTAEGAAKAVFIRPINVVENEWTELEGTFTVPPDVDRLRVGVGVGQGSGWVIFDGLWLAPDNAAPQN